MWDVDGGGDGDGDGDGGDGGWSGFESKQDTHLNLTWTANGEVGVSRA